MNRIRAWIVDTALPFWADAGFDAARGRFVERLGFDGRPVAVPQRGMLQARQIYVYAHAARLGWFPEGAALAETAMAGLLRDFCERSGGQASFAFSVGADGRVVSAVRDAYAHAFILFAIAHLHRLNGDPRLLALADAVIAFVDAHLVDPDHGGLFDRYPVDDRCKRQNPLMHLLEAFLALEEAAPGRGYIARGQALVTVFKHHLFDAAQGALFEYFAPDWSAHPEPGRRHVAEPGHLFEWVWLLRQYESLTGETLEPWITALFATAHRDGVSPDGLVVDEVTREGRILKASHRLWPHAEGLKAAVVRHADGDPQARGFARTMIAALAGNFLDRPFAGGWIDHIDPAGEPLVDYVPASSLYHLFLAVSEAARGFAIDGLE